MILALGVRQSAALVPSRVSVVRCARAHRAMTSIRKEGFGAAAASAEDAAEGGPGSPVDRAQEQERAKRKRRNKAARRKRSSARRAQTDAAVPAEEQSLYDARERAALAHLADDVSDEDLQKVKVELGYLPTHLRSVGARTAGGDPAVLQLHPLGVSRSFKRRRRQEDTGDMAEPFPTMYWLVSKALAIRVSNLERKAGVTILEERLESAPEDVRELQRHAHRDYAATRWALLGGEERDLAEARGWTRRLRDTGIAGMADFNKVKCLHAHYSHYLALQAAGAGGRNVVGEWVQEWLERDLDAEGAELREAGAAGERKGD